MSSTSALYGLAFVAILAAVYLFCAWLASLLARREAAKHIEIATGEALDRMARTFGMRRIVETDADLRERVNREIGRGRW